MLDYYVLPINYGVAYGSVTLKSLQNDNIPELDLLVREAIQNSSDASLKEPGDSFKVNFQTGKFIPGNLNSFITGLEDVLNEKFNTETADFMEIRDTKTAGLTGCIKKAEIVDDDHGNFFKLILLDKVTMLVAAVVCISLFLTVLLAKIIGAILPILAAKVKLDPAVMANPIITTIVDAGSLFVYFTVATMLLGI